MKVLHVLAFAFLCVGFIGKAEAQDDPLAQVNAVLQLASRVALVIPARPGLFLLSKAVLPVGKDVTIVERAGQQEFAVVYGADGKATAVLLPLTTEKFQVLVEPASLAAYDGKLKALQAPPAALPAAGATPPAPPAASPSVASAAPAGTGSDATAVAKKGRAAWGIKLGMTKDQVQALKGDPDSSSDELWTYQPLSPVGDLSSEAMSSAASHLTFGTVFANDAAAKVATKKKYEIYFTHDVVTNVVVSSY
ncbi:hypothetical protein SAMN05444156_0357 [Verrucomicrobium sp. GAS474]|uniref:hypothetical protein n=1 Tax=Verrucomicrobium sp. GAS474 TaxID=1882831 RepID=UPI00087DD8F2|nr:hypothetical protein [Verrucomicrobium sp. GAS474]SDT87893.1 hypothetical protein SAMN05444156_0357 [Verrucomicrobium sp. GAS474]